MATLSELRNNILFFHSMSYPYLLPVLDGLENQLAKRKIHGKILDAFGRSMPPKTEKSLRKVKPATKHFIL